MKEQQQQYHLDAKASRGGGRRSGEREREERNTYRRSR
jgi:hypothetical protein